MREGPSCFFRIPQRGSKRSSAGRVFPQEHRWINTKTKEQGRHHIDESLVQKAVRDAVMMAGLTKRATHLLESGSDIRTVQE